MSDNVIWAVVSGEYSDYRVHCAAATEAEAEALMKRLPKDDASYTGYSLQQIPFGTVGELNKRRLWCWHIRHHLPPSSYTGSNTDVPGSERGEIVLFVGNTPINGVWTETQLEDWGGSCECAITAVSERSLEHAGKIAHDLLAKWKSERLLEGQPARTPAQIRAEESA